MPNVYAIVPAAGRSRRMGTQKLLLPFAGTTVIEHIIRQLSAAPARGVIAVVQDVNDDVATAAARAGATPVVNPDADGDMLSSIRCGVRALPPECDGALIALGDQPTIRAELVAAMLSASERRPGAIVVPLHKGRRGHPVLVPADLFEAVLARYEGVGLKGLLGEHPGRVQELPTADGAVVQDMDDREAYQQALRAQDGL